MTVVIGTVAQGVEQLCVGIGTAAVVLVKDVYFGVRVCCLHEINA